MAMARFDSRLRSYLPVLLLALVLRVFGIATESFWVDEAFCAATTSGPIAQTLELTAKDTHPPAYFLGLSLWRQMFAQGDIDPTGLAIVLRGYSVAWSLLGLLLLMELARSMAGWPAARLAGVFAAFNPLDIYFANEARMYAQATTIALAGALALWHWTQSVRHGGAPADWWRAAAVFAVCGAALLLTHYAGVTFLVGQGLLVLPIFARQRAWSSLVGLSVATLAVAVTFLPWLAYVLSLRESIVNETVLGWMPFPGFTDYFSFIGREFFWGHAWSVHEQWWIATLFLPLCIFVAGVLRRRLAGSREEAAAAIHLLGHMVLPLLVCAIVSMSYQVVYYRPRYSIFVLPYFLIGLAMACRALGARRWVNLAATAVILLMATGVVVQERTPQKRAWRQTADSWPQGDAPAFYVVLPVEHQRPLAHYLGGRIRHTPRHVLERLLPLPEGALIWVANWPEPLSAQDAAYRDWLARVGPARNQALSSYYMLTQVEPPGGAVWPEFAERRFRAWFRPFDVRGEVAGFSDASRFAPLTFDAAGDPVRKSERTAWLRFDRVLAGEVLVVRAAPYGRGEGEGPVAQLRALRAEDPSDLFSRGVVATFDATSQEYRVPAPQGDGPLWIGWQIADATGDGLLLHWAGITGEGPPRMVLRD